MKLLFLLLVLQSANAVQMQGALLIEQANDDGSLSFVEDLLTFSYSNSHLMHHHRTLQINRFDDMRIEKCEDATEIYRGGFNRFNNGTNWLTKFYQCSCEGDLAGSFTLHCVRTNFCFPSTRPLTNESFQVCMKSVEIRIDMQIVNESGHGTNSANKSVDVSFATHCHEYETGGPVSGKLCGARNYECWHLLRDAHNRLTEDASLVCDSLYECRPLIQELGYDHEFATRMCPTRTLNNRLCKSNLGEFAKRREGICNDRFGFDYSLTPDCSNVEACAVPSCRSTESTRENRHIPVYAQCGPNPLQLSANETPPASAFLLQCQGANVTQQTVSAELDNCVYQSGYLSQDNVRQCQECLVSTIVAKGTFDGRNNCANYENSVCGIFLSNCLQVCGPCSKSGYDMVQCITSERLFPECSLNCPPPANVGNGWEPIHKQDPNDLDISGARSLMFCCNLVLLAGILGIGLV